MDTIELDTDQRNALAAILEGNSRRIFGGPGTGKTVLITEALAALIERDGRDSVRVVTPSRQSASRLRDQLSLRVGVATRGPLARSMSSFAYDIVSTDRGASFPVRLIAGGEQDSDIRSLLAGEIEDGTDGYWPDTLGPEVRSLREFRTQLRDLLSRARDAGLVDPLTTTGPLLSRLSERGKRHDVPEWVASAQFLDTYLRLSVKARPSQVDPAAIIDEATTIISSEGYVSDLRTLLVDDAQDLTVSQWRFLAAWNNHRGPVIAVGDPDLATSGFRGATPTLFTGSENVETDMWAPSMVLTSNHRQSGVMPHVLGVIAKAIPGSVAAIHRSYPEDTEPANIRDMQGFSLFSATAASPAGEFETIARFIQNQAKNGVSPTDVAVIVRSGSIAEGLVDYLTASSIPAFAETTGSPLRDHATVWSLLTIIGVGSGYTEFTPEIARQLLTGPFGRMSTLDYRRFRRLLRLDAIKAGDYRLADDLMMEALTIPGAFETSVARSEKGVALLISLIAAVRANPTWQMDELLWLVWTRSGRADVWAAESRGTGPIAARAHESLDAALALFAVAATDLENSPTETVDVFLARMLDQHVPNDTLTPRATLGSVTVCTPAAAIGREFDTVIVAGVNDGVWPNLRARSALVKSTLLPFAVEGANLDILDQRQGILADEIRLFLVALSRARSTALVTAISSEDESPSGLFRIIAGEKLKDEETTATEPAANSRAQVFSPTRVFASLSELVGYARNVLLDDSATAHDRDQAALALFELAKRGVRGAAPDEWLGMDLGNPRELFADSTVKLSPSGLKKFEESAVDWFVSQVSGGSAGIDAAVGTLLHAAVENAPSGSTADLLETVNDRWDELGFQAPWQGLRWRKLADQMALALADYIRETASQGFAPVVNEGHISVKLVDPDDGTLDALVSGSIDRVEMNDAHAARIIDIKTGKSVESPDKHLQLKAYQWALSMKAIAELPEDSTSAGAALLYPRVKQGTKALFTLKSQQPLTEAQLVEFEQLLVAMAQSMKSNDFTGPSELGYFDQKNSIDSQWVRIGEVGSDE